MNMSPPDRDYFEALRATGATWVRLVPDKWKAQGGRDFLIGNADDYQGLVAADLATLRRVLDDANAAGLKVVLTPLSTSACGSRSTITHRRYASGMTWPWR
ncbi:hypothetical protein G6F24_017270 [Rhizopus arrhizus]|nr:hypothetical protein G6F24_017270 [Rhizopus arrhizus]